MKRVINDMSKEISTAAVEKVTEWVQPEKKGMKTQVQICEFLGLEELLKKVIITALLRRLGS